MFCISCSSRIGMSWKVQAKAWLQKVEAEDHYHRIIKSSIIFWKSKFRESHNGINLLEANSNWIMKADRYIFCPFWLQLGMSWRLHAKSRLIYDLNIKIKGSWNLSISFWRSILCQSQCHDQESRYIYALFISHGSQLSMCWGSEAKSRVGISWRSWSNDCDL